MVCLPMMTMQLPKYACFRGAASIYFDPICSGARRAAAGRTGLLPRPANAALGRLGPKGADGFLCHHPFMPGLQKSCDPLLGRRFLHKYKFM